MNVSDLRESLRPIVGDLKDYSTNAEMPNFCATTDLPPPPEAMSKRERLEGAFDLLADERVRCILTIASTNGGGTSASLLWRGLQYRANSR
jgi:hypothetical protein